MSLPATDITQTGIAAWGTSTIRTYVPLAVGALFTWLGINLGEHMLNEQLEAGLTEYVVTAGALGWYALLRAVEPRLPKWARALLFFSTKLPTYAPAEKVAAPPRELVDPATGETVLAYLVTDLK